MKKFMLLCLLSTLYACSHPLEIIGEGDILSSTGTRNCYLEDFQAGKDSCAVNLVVRDYQETYYAMPRDGWVFASWKNYCTDGSTADQCSFNVDADVVRQFWGGAARPLVAVFEKSTPIDPVVFNDGGSHVIDSDISTGIRVEDGTSVTIATGVTISGPQALVAEVTSGSSVTVNGGNIQGRMDAEFSAIILHAGFIDRAYVREQIDRGLSMTGGKVNYFDAYFGKLSMSGGEIVTGKLFDGDARISGGVIGSMTLAGSTSFGITGGQFEKLRVDDYAGGAISGGSFPSTIEVFGGDSFVSFIGDLTLGEPVAIEQFVYTRRVSGTLQDGNPIDADIECFFHEHLPEVSSCLRISVSQSPIVFNDGGSHVIYADISTGIRVEDGTSVTIAPGVTISSASLYGGLYITVNGGIVQGEIRAESGCGIILNDGAIGSADILDSLDGFTMTAGSIGVLNQLWGNVKISGGAVDRASVYDGQVDISGGVIGSMSSNGSTGLRITGGRVENKLLLDGYSAGFISGGTIVPTIEVIGLDASLQLSGDLTLGEPIAIDETLYNRRVSGILADGTAIDGDIECTIYPADPGVSSCNKISVRP